MNLNQPTVYSLFHLLSQNFCEVGRYPSSHTADEETKTLKVKKKITQGLSKKRLIGFLSCFFALRYVLCLLSALLSIGGNCSS